MSIKEGEVYWCSLGENVGDEENGKGDSFRRPILIIKKFNNHLVWGIPMSTKLKQNPYYMTVLLKGSVQSALISQLRTLDTKRLSGKIGYIRREDFYTIRRAVAELIKN